MKIKGAQNKSRPNKMPEKSHEKKNEPEKEELSA
jgi:hypothetical protein